MRKRLGSPGQAPVKKLEQSFSKNTFALVSCVIAVIFVHFGINFVVDMYNFLEKNSQGHDLLLHGHQMVWTFKGVLACASVVFILSRQS